MKIESAAGEFEFHIETLKVAGNEVVVVGKMGVWEAETSMEPRRRAEDAAPDDRQSGVLAVFAATPPLRRVRPEAQPRERDE